MKSIAFIFSLATLLTNGPQAMAQNHDCFNIGISSLRLIPSYYAQGKPDSGRFVFSYWDRNCKSSLIDRTRIVFSLEDGSFSEHSLDDSFVYSLVQSSENLAGRPTIRSHMPREYTDTQDAYEAFLSMMASEARSKASKGTVGYLVARHFSGDTDSTLILLQSAEYAETRLRHTYNDEIHRVKEDVGDYWGIAVGGWYPISSDLKGFGRLTEFTLGGMTSRKRLEFHLNVSFRLGPAKEPYTYSYEGVQARTKKFFAWSLGGGVGRSLLLSPRIEISVFGGLLFDQLSPENPFSDKSVGSLLATVGARFGFRIRPLRSPLLNLEARFNPYLFSDGKVDGVPGGSSATLRLGIYFSSGDDRADQLKRLSYLGD